MVTAKYRVSSSLSLAVISIKASELINDFIYTVD